MVQNRPTWLDARNLFAVGFLGVIALLTAEASNKPARLWAELWFIPCIAVSLLLVAIGLYGFVAHYGRRTIPLLLITTAALGVVLHWPFVILSLVAAATVFSVLYFLDPPAVNNERVALLEQQRNAVEQRLDAVQKQYGEAQAESEALHRELQAARTHPPIYFTQVEELEAWDPMRLATGRTTRTIKKLNPFFLKVDELEQAQAQLSATRAELETLKKQAADDVTAEAAKYDSRILEMLRICAEREQERDTAKAELAELRATPGSLSHERYFSRRTLRIADVIAEGGMLRDKTFEECTLQGPAVVHFGPGFSNQDPSFTNGNGKLFLVSDRVTPGIIYIRDCRFIRCTFANVAILATEVEAAEFKKRAGMEHLDI